MADASLSLPQIAYVTAATLLFTFLYTSDATN